MAKKRVLSPEEKVMDKVAKLKTLENDDDEYVETLIETIQGLKDMVGEMNDYSFVFMTKNMSDFTNPNQTEEEKARVNEFMKVLSIKMKKTTVCLESFGKEAYKLGELMMPEKKDHDHIQG